jgi:Schlafen, AlbA_2
MAIDLSDLIEVPREDLEIELKEWLDLDENAVRANLARHIAALANHGGGYLIFGFQDDLSRDQKRPPSLDKYNRDTFTGIIKRYLTPTFQCEVLTVAAKDGGEFPVIRIPSHGRVPIVAKADGPRDDKGRVQGIQSNTYYVRKPGPESAPITSGEEWSALIRRCVLNDRDSLLRDIAGLVEPGAKSAPEPRLIQWHRDAEERFRHLLARAKKLAWPISIDGNRCQLSYLISKDDDQLLPEQSLRQILEEVNNEVRDTVWTGWSMFYPFRGEPAPTFYPEHPDGTGPDVLESNLMDLDSDFDLSLPDFWRVAVDGRASLVRPYREDRSRNVRELQRAAGTWLSPETVIRETAELVTHARCLARRFAAARQVSFRCTWIGLENRELADFDTSAYWNRRIAKASQRTVEGEWATATLAASWPSIVAELGCPILRLFGFTDCSPAFVRGMAPKFIKL